MTVGYGSSSGRIPETCLVGFPKPPLSMLPEYHVTRSYLYHADRSYALVLGRPHAIQDDYTSTLPPSNIDDELSPGRKPSAPSPSSPTPMTFVILRHALASIIGRMVHHFQQVRTPSRYSEVLSLDDELLRFIDNLPSHFSFKPDTSLDESCTYIPVHRFLLITEILFVRIGLHRPYLLRRLSSDRYSRSRKACFDSAMKDSEVRKAFRKSIPKETRETLSNAYREFQTAMISGIYLVLEPKGRDADAMHAILDAFVKDHEGIREMDETTRRELKTIEFLKKKASQVESKVEGPRYRSDKLAVVDHGVSGQDLPMDAHLLLGLHKSTPSRPSSKPTFSGHGASTSSSPRTPAAYTTAPPMSHSPTFQRLQQTPVTDGLGHSPAGSASPSADDEAAQTLLDHWCNTVSNGPTNDGSTGTSMAWGTPNGIDFSTWSGGTPAVPGYDPPLLDGLDTSDWIYWEALVNQIQRAP